MNNITKPTDEKFEVLVLIHRWVTYQVTIERFIYNVVYNNTYDKKDMHHTLQTEMETGLIDTRIDNLVILSTSIQGPIFKVYKMSQFNNVWMQNCFINEYIVLTNIFRSQNVILNNNWFIGHINIIRVGINLPDNKTQLLTNDYSSHIKDWYIERHVSDLLSQEYVQYYRSVFFFQFNISSIMVNTVASAKPDEIEKLKMNLGVRVQNLTMKFGMLGYDKNNLMSYQYSPLVHTERAFYFEMSGCQFSHNQYFTSTNLIGVNYINISDIEIKDSSGWPQAYMNLRMNEFISTNTYQILYFFNITSFHDIQINKITVDNTTFEQSLFKISQNSQKLQQQTIETKQQPVLNVSNIKILKQVCLKLASSSGGALFHVSSIHPIKFTFQDSMINDLKMYQQTYFRNDVAVIIYFNDTQSQKSQFIAKNLTITNNAFQYKKGLFCIQAQKVSFRDISLKDNQGQLMKHSLIFQKYKYIIEFSKIESKGSIMEIHSQKMEIKNMDVDNVLSKEAGILNIVVEQPSDVDSVGLDDNNDLYVLKVHNCSFTNVMTYSQSILFNINLNKVDYSKVGNRVNDLIISFDRLMVQNVFSYRSGPVFQIDSIDQEKLVIQNSEFRSFKSGSREQFIQFLSSGNTQYQYNYDKHNYKLMYYSFDSQYVSKSSSKKMSKLTIQNCRIDNIGVVNRYINYLQQIDFYNHNRNTNRNQWFQNRKQFDKLMKYTQKSIYVKLDSSFLQLLKAVENENTFTGGQLITIQNSIVDIKDSLITNIETLQANQENKFPLILKSVQNSEVRIQNTSFINLGPNQKGLFEIANSRFSLKGCSFDQIFDIHDMQNSFGYQISQQQQFSGMDNYIVYNVFNNDKYMIGDNLKQFKGGLIAQNSTIEILNNRFEKINCKECNGLVLSIKSSQIRILNNVFDHNSAQQATCVQIDGNQVVHSSSKPSLEKKNDHYIVNNPTIEISNNNFTNNNATSVSAAIYMKYTGIVQLKNNRFENNRASYGTCLYTTEQKNVGSKSIVASYNHFINNKATSIAQIYYKDLFIYNMKSNKFSQNSAYQFSPKVFSYPDEVKLNSRSLVGSSKFFQKQYIMNNFGSNRQIIPLEFVFYDEMGDMVNLDQYISSKNFFSQIVQVKRIVTVFSDKIEGTIYQKQNSTQINKDNFNNPNSININKTWINNNLQITASPLSQVQIEFTISIIKQFNKTMKQFMNGSSFNLIINFRECQPGEYYDQEQNYCQKCPINTFSFDVKNPCKRYEKVGLMEYAYGGNKTSVKKGTWRSKNNTEKIIACEEPKHCEPNVKRFPDASNSSGNQLCRLGHMGPLCQSCDHYGVFWNGSYQYSVKDQECIDCEGSKWTIIFFFMFLVVLGLFTAYTVKKQVTTSQDLTLRQKLKNIGHLLISKKHRSMMAAKRVAANKAYCDLNRKKQDTQKRYPMKLKYKQRDDGFSYDVYVQEGDEKTKKEMNILQVDFSEIIQQTALIKIIVTYLLILSITVQSTKDQFKDLNWVQQVAKNLGQPLKQAMYSAECYIIMLRLKSVPVYLIKHIIIIMTPLLNWLVFLLIWRLVLRSKINKSVMLNSITFIFFYNYPQIIQSIFPAVIKQNYDGVDYVQADPKYLYNSQQQFNLRMLFYFPVLVFFLVIIPAISVCFLKKNIDKLYDPDFQMKYGFIYQEYRNQCYYIEFIKIALKILIMITQSIYIDSMQLQISVIQQVLTVYLVVIIIVKPYTQHSANAIEMYNIIVCLLNMILANSIHWSQAIDSRMTTNIFIGIFLAINITLTVILVYFFFIQKVTQINEKIVQLKHNLVARIPRLKKIKYFKSTVNADLSSSKLWKSLFRSTLIQEIKNKTMNKEIDNSNQLNSKSSMYKSVAIDRTNQCKYSNDNKASQFSRQLRLNFQDDIYSIGNESKNSNKFLIDKNRDINNSSSKNSIILNSSINLQRRCKTGIYQSNRNVIFIIEFRFINQKMIVF